ncbi:MAG: serine hydrolase [Clostridiales bacterium]
MKQINCPMVDWEQINPQEVNIDPKKLSKLNSVISKDYKNICGMVIVKNGCIAYENYFDDYTPNDTVHIASATKSILSALIGIAIDKGDIKSIDQKVIDFFPEYLIKARDQVKKEITIKHLLTMTAPYKYQSEPWKKICTSPDWAIAALEFLGGRGSIGDFKYSTAGANILSAIITRSTGKTALEYANENLFSPLGMNKLNNYKIRSETEYMEFFKGKYVTGWVVDPNNNNTGGWGLTLTSRDMAKFGLLYLNNGQWNDKQIISKKWVKNSITNTENHYGYLWWIVDEPELSAYCALGDGGNVIFCIPDKSMVIAIASKFMPKPKDRMILIKEHILREFL